MVLILLRKCEMETGMGLVGWLEHFGEPEKDATVDVDDDKQLRAEVYKMLKENYLDQEQQKASS